MITHVCVAIQLLGTAAAPDAVQALRQHCDSILGDGECRMTSEGSGEGESECWRATLVRTADDAVASVVVGGSGAAAGRVAQRDVKFQSNDQRTDRWATLGLVIAALVTQEEHAAAASAPPANAPAVPATETLSPTGSSWFSRDRSAPNTIAEQPEEVHGLMHLADLRLLGVWDAGRLPWATVGGRVSATFGLVHHLDLEIGGTYLVSTAAIAPPGGSGGTGKIHFDLRSLTVGLCPRSRVSPRLSGHVCAGGDIGLMTVSAPDDPTSQNGYLFLPDVWLGFDSMIQLTGHLALVIEYKAEVIIRQPPSVLAASDNLLGSTTRIFQSERFSENTAIGVAGTF